MKVLLHTYRCPAVERWQRFESMLEACLLELGHHVAKVEYVPTLPSEPGDFDIRIYPHTSRHQIPHGDLFFKEMFMHDLFTIDPDGWGPEHSGLRRPPDLSRIDPAVAEEFCGEMRRGFLATGHSKHGQPPLRPIDAGLCPYLLAPLQVPTDDAVKFHSSVSVLDYVNFLSDWAERARMRVVFKLHPGREFPEIAETVRRRVASGRYVTLLDENIHALIANAAGVVVLTSGVGFESLIHGKPVVTLGRSDYRWVTFNTTPHCLGAALAYVREYSKAQREAAAKFIYYYYQQHAYLTVGAAAAASKVRLLGYLKKAVGVWAMADPAAT
jgi:Capsule polysaccharide biosynthesis protein